MPEKLLKFFHIRFLVRSCYWNYFSFRPSQSFMSMLQEISWNFSKSNHQRCDCIKPSPVSGFKLWHNGTNVWNRGNWKKAKTTCFQFTEKKKVECCFCKTLYYKNKQFFCFVWNYYWQEQLKLCVSFANEKTLKNRRP